jgi:hypothetical protein
LNNTPKPRPAASRPLNAGADRGFKELSRRHRTQLRTIEDTTPPFLVGRASVAPIAVEGYQVPGFDGQPHYDIHGCSYEAEISNQPSYASASGPSCFNCGAGGALRIPGSTTTATHASGGARD